MNRKVVLILCLTAMIGSSSITARAQCTADFAASPTRGCASLKVKFTDKSSNATNWQWAFQGGTPSTATGAGPHYVTYNTPGSYSVSLQISCKSGSDTITRNKYIIVEDCNCQADFYTKPRVGCAPFKAEFHDMSTGAANWEWTFPGGSPASASGEGPHVVEYITPGTYDVKLKIECKSGSDIETKTNYIRIEDCSCTADFSADHPTGYTPHTVRFTSHCTNATSWFWRFPGGNPSSWQGEKPPPITYHQAGKHDVRLDITCDNGSDVLLLEEYIEIKILLPYDYGDAPENAVAYPDSGIMGRFPTCLEAGPAGYIRHGSNSDCYFGYQVDTEVEGNEGNCPAFTPNLFDQDESCYESDAGLWAPDAFTIQGPPDSEYVAPLCSEFRGSALGYTCGTAEWGRDINVWWHTNRIEGAYVNVLIDWNRDGQWGASSSCDGETVPEHVLVNFYVPNGNGHISTQDPPSFKIGPMSGFVWARFTITSDRISTPWDGSGHYSDGETEDYLIKVLGRESLMDFGDAPHIGYATLLEDDGARHILDPDLYLGKQLDPESDGIPDKDALGDDNDGQDDEDGIHFENEFVLGDTTAASVIASEGGYFRGWIDYNQDGDWDDTDEVVIDTQIGSGNTSFNIIVPETAKAGSTYARFRFSPNEIPSDRGPLIGGEVEDYVIDIFDCFPYEYGDAPEGVLAYPGTGVIGQFPTCREVGPAGFIRHGNSDTRKLGFAVDFETDGNAGLCPGFSGQYDQDEWYNYFFPSGSDDGLRKPQMAYSIHGEPGSEFVLSRGPAHALGESCQEAQWGRDMEVNFNASSEGAYMNILIDWNQDGRWGGSSSCSGTSSAEHVLVNFPLTPDSRNLRDLSPPPFYIGPNPGYVWTRITISEKPVDLPWDGSGVFSDGETEDYLLRILEPGTYFDYGDAPENVLAYPFGGILGQFPTCFGETTSGYIRHASGRDLRFGFAPDLEEEAVGICNRRPVIYNAEYDDGLYHVGKFTITAPGGVYGVETESLTDEGRPIGRVCRTASWGSAIDLSWINSTEAPAFINILFDWSQDGEWAGSSSCEDVGDEAPEHVIQNLEVSPGSGYLSWMGLSPFRIGPNPGYVWCRFTISDEAVELPWDGSGEFEQGETEDYLLKVRGVSDLFDFGDAWGYLSTSKQNGAIHSVHPGICLGEIVDGEPDAHVNPDADGDDKDGVDDEDGVSFIDDLFPGKRTKIEVTASVEGILNAWIDFNGNKLWDDDGEQIFQDLQINTGKNTLFFVVPDCTTTETTFARFRFSQQSGLSYYGPAYDPDDSEQAALPPVGEVEDYRISILATGVEGRENNKTAEAFILYQNFPNPFNPTTSIRYQLSQDCRIRLDIYDLLGHKVRQLADQFQKRGVHSVVWDAGDDAGRPVPSGIYLYSLQAGKQREVKKLILLK